MSSVIIGQNIKDKNNSDEFADNILGTDSSKKEDLAKAIMDSNDFIQQSINLIFSIKIKFYLKIAENG